MEGFNIIIARTPGEFEAGKALFVEYAASLDFDLGFQGFQQELNVISEQYQAPMGALLLCFNEQQEAVGCAGIRQLTSTTAELKRLYVKPAFRSFKIGRHLLELAITTAKDLNYQFIRLDTVPGQEKAHNLYRSLGFYTIDAYRHNPIAGTIYMEKKLTG
jgi:ribosomal protein S18 acetylase RimI-like enzyme